MLCRFLPCLGQETTEAVSDEYNADTPMRVRPVE